MPTPLFVSIIRTPTVNEGESESVWMSTAAYRPLVMEERKSLGTAERIRLTKQNFMKLSFRAARFLKLRPTQLNRYGDGS